MDLRCQYASTHCPNTRSLKISGELHRFCLFHRRSANAAQRRWKQKKLAAASHSSEEETVKPTPTKPTARRRRRTAGDVDVKQETEVHSPAKRLRVSREIAAPRFQQATATQATLLPMPMMPATDALPPLFTADDVSLLSQMVLGTEETALPVYPPSDIWWADMSYQQDVGVIV